MLIPEISLLDQLPSYIGWKDLNRHYIGANKALLKLKNCRDVGEIIGKTDDDLSPGSVEENTLFERQDLFVLNGEPLSTVHFDFKTKTVFLLEKSPLVNKNDEVIGLIYSCHPHQQDEMYRILNQLDTKIDIKTYHYAMSTIDNKYQLTNREYECIFLLIRGKSAKEIGALLSLSKRTIESYIDNIKNKMDCNNKAEILVKAMLNGYHQYIPDRFNQPEFIKSL